MPGKKSGFRSAKQEADYKKAGLSLHKGHTRREKAPCDHDPCDPSARTDLLEHDVARNLEQKISEEEYSSRISISRRRDSEILVHCERSDTDIDTVKERYEVE